MRQPRPRRRHHRKTRSSGKTGFPDLRSMSRRRQSSSSSPDHCWRFTPRQCVPPGARSNLAPASGPLVERQTAACARHVHRDRVSVATRRVTIRSSGRVRCGALSHWDLSVSRGNSAPFCHAMNRQTRLDNREQHELIMNSIISPPDINTAVLLHWNRFSNNVYRLKVASLNHFNRSDGKIGIV